MDLDNDEQDLPATINVVPLIDVLFALLTFFIISTLFFNSARRFTCKLAKSGNFTGVPNSD